MVNCLVLQTFCKLTTMRFSAVGSLFSDNLLGNGHFLISARP